jgi:hypothetical protein
MTMKNRVKAYLKTLQNLLFGAFPQAAGLYAVHGTLLQSLTHILTAGTRVLW